MNQNNKSRNNVHGQNDQTQSPLTTMTLTSMTNNELALLAKNKVVSTDMIKSPKNNLIQEPLDKKQNSPTKVFRIPSPLGKTFADKIRQNHSFNQTIR